MSELAYIPNQPDGDNGFVELSKTKTGKLFRKHILSTGPLRHPVTGKVIDIDEDFLNTVKKNFDDHVCDIVQVPLAGPNNEHSEDPARNIGEVLDFKVENGKGYAYFDARDPLAIEKLDNKTLIGASAMLSMNYKDTRDGELKGPTLLHMAITNRPYVLDLEEFEEIAALSSDGSSSEAVILTVPEKQEIIPMTREELLAELKEKHNLDVVALEAQVATIPELQTSLSNAQDELAAQTTALETQTALSNDLTEKLANSGILKLSNGTEASNDDIVGAIAQLNTDKVALSNKVDELILSNKKTEAAAAVDGKISGGFILPAKRDAMIALRLSNEDLYNQLLPEVPLVQLSNENGRDVADDVNGTELVTAEIARLSATYVDAK